MSWFKDAWDWLLRKLKPIFAITADGITKEALAILNDAELQAAAKEAVLAAAERGLTGETARTDARETLMAILKKKGTSLKENAINLLIEAVLFCVKNGNSK